MSEMSAPIRKLVGRLRAGRKGLFVEERSGRRWKLVIDPDARDLLGESLRISGAQQGSTRLRFVTFELERLPASNRAELVAGHPAE